MSSLINRTLIKSQIALKTIPLCGPGSRELRLHGSYLPHFYTAEQDSSSRVESTCISQMGLNSVSFRGSEAVVTK